MAIGCRTQKNATEIVAGSMRGYEQLMTLRQVDSMCVADTLKPYDEWLSSTYYDYETSKRVTKYTYIKELTDSTEKFYILVPKDTLFLITKRIGVNE